MSPHSSHSSSRANKHTAPQSPGPSAAGSQETMAFRPRPIRSIRISGHITILIILMRRGRPHCRWPSLTNAVRPPVTQRTAVSIVPLLTVDNPV
jgi:hypothetical protein